MSNFVLGQNCKAYYSATALTSSSYATPLASSTLIDNIKDLTVNMSVGKIDIETRASNGIKAQAPGSSDQTITFTMLWKPADAAFTALLTAYQAKAEVAFFALDGVKTAASGNQGPAGNYVVTNFSRKESVGDVVWVDVELSPSSFNGWVTA